MMMILFTKNIWSLSFSSLNTLICKVSSHFMIANKMDVKLMLFNTILYYFLDKTHQGLSYIVFDEYVFHSSEKEQCIWAEMPH